MKTGVTTSRLLAYAGCGAPGAIVVGFCLARTAKQFDALALTVALIFGVCLVSDLAWIRREVRRLSASEFAKGPAGQFLWSCVFFSLICLGLGMAAGGYVWFEHDFMRRFGLGFWTIMALSATYPLFRDAKRLGETSKWSGATRA